MWIHLIAVSVGAEPTFEGNDKAVETADRLWRAAVGCAGRAAPAHPTVRIDRGRNPTELVRSVTEIDEHGLVRVDIVRDDSTPTAFAHALARAWFPEGPLALRDGLSEHLAECVAQALPSDVPNARRDTRPLDELEDLRDWGALDYFEPTDEQLLDLRSASWRLAQLLADALPREVLYGGELTSWEALAEALREVEHGPDILEMLEGGEETQRGALLDADEDGLLGMQEQWLGTDPDRWDSDDDGWWDGYDERPEHAIPVPRDGSPVCLNQVARSGRTTIEIGGRMRGVSPTNFTTLDFRRFDLFRQPAEAASGRGGLWIRPAGTDLVENSDCHWSPRVTVRVAPAEIDEVTYEESVAGLRSKLGFNPIQGATAADLRAVAAAATRAAEAYDPLSPMRWRLHVELGPGDSMELRNTDRTPSLMVPARSFRRAMRNRENLESMMYVAVALQRLTLRTAGASHPGTAVLLASHELDRRLPAKLATSHAALVDVRKQFEADCEEGWTDVFAGYCLDRIDPEELKARKREEKNFY